ncbi:hypothetical protein [Aquisalimonas asiatica]|uniref:Uncharacterized protein n=1 Tax=Aquisalimonas asiatica TaxID=406100 RepID=A0A1H8TN08_9GAMM|nr:hypothetical protein [Aquisalimonas asiatica]SEO92429.1 hypothetical protein SAMN04488052_104338 [Aquisalimonas asiatica]
MAAKTKAVSQVEEARSRIDSAADQLHQEVEGIRSQIRDLSEKKDQVLNAPLPRKEVESRIDAWLEENASEFYLPERATQFASSDGRGDPPLSILTKSNGNLDMGPALAALFREEIREKLIQAAVNAPGYEPGLPLDQRGEKAEKIDREILDLEISEERIITSAEEAGITIPRRPDADPRTVLEVIE